MSPETAEQRAAFGERMKAVYSDNIQPTSWSEGVRTLCKVKDERAAVECVAECYADGWPLSGRMEIIRDLMLAGF